MKKLKLFFKLSWYRARNLFLLFFLGRKTTSYIYLETSAINFFSEIYTPARAKKEINRVKLIGLNFRTSSLAFWEILNTSNDVKREQLIYFNQHFLPFPLLPSPEEMIIDWLNLGCPLNEPKRNLVSKSNISNIWLDLIRNRNKTFVLDRSQLANQLNLQRRLGKSIRNVILNETGKKDPLLGVDLSATLAPLVNKMTIVKENPNIDSSFRQKYRVSLLFILLILCAELTIEREPIEEFWKKVGVSNTADRLFYILNNFEEAIYRGPFATMAEMAVNQFERRHSRGLWMDCLHSIYLTYSDLYFSGDQHFVDLEKKEKLFRKIIKVQDLLNIPPN